jgi:hypothetical protein
MGISGLICLGRAVIQGVRGGEGMVEGGGVLGVFGSYRREENVEYPFLLEPYLLPCDVLTTT